MRMLDARSPGPFLCSTPAGFSVLLHSAQLPFLLGLVLRLDSLLWPPLSHAHHPIRTTHPVQALLFIPSLLQPSPLESRRSGPLRLPNAVTFLFRGFARRRR